MQYVAFAASLTHRMTQGSYCKLMLFLSNDDSLTNLDRTKCVDALQISKIVIIETEIGDNETRIFAWKAKKQLRKHTRLKH